MRSDRTRLDKFFCSRSTQCQVKPNRAPNQFISKQKHEPKIQCRWFDSALWRPIFGRWRMVLVRRARLRPSWQDRFRRARDC